MTKTISEIAGFKPLGKWPFPFYLGLWFNKELFSRMHKMTTITKLFKIICVYSCKVIVESSWTWKVVFFETSWGFFIMMFSLYSTLISLMLINNLTSDSLHFYISNDNNHQNYEDFKRKVINEHNMGNIHTSLEVI